MSIEAKKIVIALYAVSLFGMIAFGLDTMQWARYLYYFRYIYIGVLWLYIIFKLPYFHKAVGIFFVSVLSFTILWGFVFVNPSVLEEIHANAKDLILYFLFVFGTAHFIYFEKYKKQFVKVTFYIYLIIMAWAYLTHWSGFAPIRYLVNLAGVFHEQLTYGFTYGFSHYNLTGNIISCMIWLFLLYYAENKRNKIHKSTHSLMEVAAVAVFFWMISLLSTTTSRGEILGTTSVFISLVLLKIKREQKHRIRNNIILMIILIGCIIYLSYATINDVSSGRTQNWAVNWEIFREIGRYTFGMGLVNPWGYLTGVFPGYKTWPCDVYWYYLFFSTGILGSIFMGGILISLFLKIFKGSTTNYTYDAVIKSGLISIIINDFFHAVIFSVNYISSTVYFIFFIEFLLESRKSNKSINRLEK